MSGPLSGLRVVEGSAFVAAPSGGMALAQLGADVIRFDAIGGGIDAKRWPVTEQGTSLYWTGLNKGKRSIQVDLRSPEGRELVTALIGAPGPDGGVFLSNFPAVGWMSYESLRTVRDDLIMVNIIGNHDGTTAVDYTVNCAVGYPQATGPVGITEPVNHVLPAWDVICGQMAAVGVLAAERHRTRHGDGQLVTLALSDVALHTVASMGHVAEAQLLGTERPRLGNDLYGALGRDFATADGRRVIAVAISPKQWESLGEATALADTFAALADELGVDLARDEGARFLARDRIFALLEQWCAARSLAEVAERFEAHGVCWGPYQTFGQLVSDDPRCSEANPMFAMVDQPGAGPYLTPSSPLAFGAFRRTAASPAPVIGQHTDEVLAEVLGLSGAEISRLHDERVVAGPA